MTKVILAAAGSGKTEYICREALKLSSKVLITTYTDKNTEEIVSRFYKIHGSVPSNVTILPWFTYLLRHGIKPYQDIFYKQDIQNIEMVNGISARYTNKENANHYFTSESLLYSDKIAELWCKLNNDTKGQVLELNSQLFDNILIDEIQDMSNYDLEVISLLSSKNAISVTCVGDPRQGVFVTSKGAKNKQYQKANIIDFFEKNKKIFTVDNNTLNINYRCNAHICNLSNKVFPNFPEVGCKDKESTGHDGVFFIKPEDIDVYKNQFSPIQLRYNAKTKVDGIAYNFGMVKGMSFDRVLIYPTKPMLAWLTCGTEMYSSESKAKLYVALTRARYSVGIVYDYKENNNNVHEIQYYKVEDMI